MSESRENITTVLRTASSGDRDDLNALMTAIYDDIRRIVRNSCGQSGRITHSNQQR